LLTEDKLSPHEGDNLDNFFLTVMMLQNFCDKGTEKQEAHNFLSKTLQEVVCSLSYCNLLVTNN
jgi:hypothetical protein